LYIFQVMILVRCFYSIIKYYLGWGVYIPEIGKIRLGQENDFADFFLLLFIMSFVRLLFEDIRNRKIFILNIVSVLASSSVIIFSFRRYLWVEFVIAVGLILLVYSRSASLLSKRVIVAACSFVFVLSSVFLLAGSERVTQNHYIGRFMTAFSLLDSRFESQYGTDTRHPDEIKEGWDNVKKHWLLGVSPYGGDKLTRYETKAHRDVYVHCAYLGIWLSYGLLGVVLFVAFYVKSFLLGYKMYFRNEHAIGIVLATFIVCQMIKNIVWHSAFQSINVTIVYLFFISFVLREADLIRSGQSDGEA